MDTRLDEDEPKLGVAVFPVCLEMLADGNRLFDEVPEVLRDGWAKSYPQTKRCRRMMSAVERMGREGREGRSGERGRRKAGEEVP